jgi:hypothetical protein
MPQNLDMFHKLFNLHIPQSTRTIWIHLDIEMTPQIEPFSSIQSDTILSFLILSPKEKYGSVLQILPTVMLQSTEPTCRPNNLNSSKFDMHA